MTDIPFSRLVGQRRQSLGLTQARLAELVGRSPSAVRSWERGRSQPTEEGVISSLAAVLGLDEALLRRAAGLEPEATDRPSPAAAFFEEIDESSEAAWDALSAQVTGRVPDRETVAEPAAEEEEEEHPEPELVVDLEAQVAPVGMSRTEVTASQRPAGEPPPDTGRSAASAAPPPTAGAPEPVEEAELEPPVAAATAPEAEPEPTPLVEAPAEREPEAEVAPEEPIDEPVAEVAPEEPIDEPVAEVAPEEPIDEPVAEVAPEEPIDEPVAEVAPEEPIDEPEPETTPEMIDEPVAEFAPEEPIDEPVVEVAPEEQIDGPVVEEAPALQPLPAPAPMPEHDRDAEPTRLVSEATERVAVLPPGQPSYLEDRQQMATYWVRTVLTVGLGLFLFIVFIWAMGQLGDSLAAVWELFRAGG